MFPVLSSVSSKVIEKKKKKKVIESWLSLEFRRHGMSVYSVTE